MNILVVDDIKENLYFMESLLNGSGYTVTTSINGKEALKMLAKEDFEMIISDILMPVMDGFELCQKVKKNKNYKDIPFIFYTATYTDKKDEDFALKLGAAKFIIKPQEPQNFLNIIKEVMDKKQNDNLPPHSIQLENEKEIYKLYNERLVNKLEKKMLDLEKEKKERKIIEDEIKTLAHAMKCINESVSMTDMNKKIQFVNQAFIKNYGYSEEELIGQPINVLLFPNTDKKTINSMLSETINNGWQGEILQKKKNGLEFPAYVSTSVMKGNEEQPVALIWIFTDISKQKQLEEQFLQAQKMEAIGRLAGGIAHDFNNLLTVINGYSEIMLMKFNENDPMYTKIKGIHQAGRQAESLTGQLLAFSRKQVMQNTILDISIVMKNIEKMLIRLIGENIELISLIDPDIERIKADSSQVEQVIMNLVINSRDAMPNGGKITIKIKNIVFDEPFKWADLTIEPGRFLMLSVSDTGTGINHETIKHVFEPFFTTKKENEGTGLGLAMVYGIIKQSGGFINVYSEPGKGTIFKIYFPSIKDPASKISKTAISINSLSGNETILVAEDDDNLRNLTCMMLRDFGYNVLEAANGGSALLKCEKYKGPIHLILSDVVMPEMSGLDLVKRLHSIYNEMKVLYMSGYTDDEVIKHGIIEERVQFLQKPFKLESLLNKVRQVLDDNY